MWLLHAKYIQVPKPSSHFDWPIYSIASLKINIYGNDCENIAQVPRTLCHCGTCLDPDQQWSDWRGWSPSRDCKVFSLFMISDTRLVLMVTIMALVMMTNSDHINEDSICIETERQMSNSQLVSIIHCIACVFCCIALLWLIAFQDKLQRLQLAESTAF